MNIKQFRYSADNLGYLVYSDKNAIAVDGGAVEEILDFLKSNDIALKYVTNTHSHGDHTCGNARLLKESGAEFADYRSLVKNGLEMDNERINIYITPGHTADSIILKVNDNLLTGDTLFIGKVGRCFSGDLKGFLESIKLILQFPDNTVFYPGHDYVEEYLDFVRMLEPDNEYIDQVLESNRPEMIRSNLGVEKKLNPFLRFNEPEIAALLEKRDLPAATEFERWESLISLM